MSAVDSRETNVDRFSGVPDLFSGGCSGGAKGSGLLLYQRDRSLIGTAEWAHRYCKMGLALTWTRRGQKGPRHQGWTLRENAITDPQIAERNWSRFTSQGIACLLTYSALVSLDIDEPEYAPVALKTFGVDLTELVDAVPGVVGRPGRIRLLFRAPDVALKHCNAKWPVKGDPRKTKVLFELRAGAVADMLPPSVHPDTQQPYAWRVPPGNGEFPPLPQALLDLWLDWPQTERRIWELCPWAPAWPQPHVRARQAFRQTGPSVIQQFNSVYDAVAIIESFGYRRAGRRWVAPGSTHAPGIALLDDGRIFSHHAGDRLCDGHAHDAFSIWAKLAYGGDVRHAVRAAVRLLRSNEASV